MLHLTRKESEQEESINSSSASSQFNGQKAVTKSEPVKLKELQSCVYTKQQIQKWFDVGFGFHEWNTCSERLLTKYMDRFETMSLSLSLGMNASYVWKKRQVSPL